MVDPKVLGLAAIACNLEATFPETILFGEPLSILYAEPDSGAEDENKQNTKLV
jgi:hypothetical protein